MTFVSLCGFFEVICVVANKLLHRAAQRSHSNTQRESLNRNGICY